MQFYLTTVLHMSRYTSYRYKNVLNISFTGCIAFAYYHALIHSILFLSLNCSVVINTYGGIHSDFLELRDSIMSNTATFEIRLFTCTLRVGPFRKFAKVPVWQCDVLKLMRVVHQAVDPHRQVLKLGCDGVDVVLAVGCCRVIHLDGRT